MAERTVKCVKIGRELPGMARPPFPGALGQRIYDNVSQQAWGMWQQQSTVIINHYGLNLADPQAQEFLMQQMEEFFFGAGAQMPEDWIPEGEGAPSDKGGPAPRKK